MKSLSRLRARIVFLLLGLCYLLNGGEVAAQIDLPSEFRTTIGDSKGTDFWLCFPQNALDQGTDTRLTVRIYITSDRPTTGIITAPGIGFRRPFSLGASEIIPIDLDNKLQIVGSEQILKLGVHVTSDNPVAVYGLSNRKKSTDSFLALPTNVLGTMYRALGYRSPTISDQFSTQFDVVATEDHTQVIMTVTGDTRGGRKPGDTFAIELNAGDVYQVQGLNALNTQSDLSGSLITSNKPVALLTGHTCAQVPFDKNFCDQLLEMEPPIPSWGRQFFIGKFDLKPTYAIRVLASEDNTQVYFDNKMVAKLKAGDYYESNAVNDNSFITSSKPVLVAQYAPSSTADDQNVGDPFMMFITPTEQFLPYYRFVTPIRGDWHHYINLVVPLDAIASLRLDGREIPARYFRQIGISRYGIAQYEIGYGTHSVICDKPVGLYSYGFGVGTDNYDSYGNAGGQLVQTVPLVKDTLAPALEIVSTDAERILPLIAREDRLFDVGLKSITVIDSDNFRSPVEVPKFDPGSPQVPFNFYVRDSSICGFLSLRLEDLAGNISYWVVCRTRFGAGWEWSLQEGRTNICPSCRSWTAQFIATPGFTISNVTFDKPSYLGGIGEYKDFRTRLSGGFAGYYLFPFNKSLQIAAGLGFSNFTGAASATHTSFVSDSILYGEDPGAGRSKLVEEFVAQSAVNYLTASGGIYYYFIPEQLYLYSGLSAGFLLQSHLTQTAEILYPGTLEYQTGRSTGSRKITLRNMNLPDPTKFLLAIELAPGLQFKLSKQYSLLTGLYMNLPLFDAVKDLNWHLTTFGARIGIQYRR